MNILFFARLFYPHIGGVEKHVFEISKILIKKKGYKIIVFTEQFNSKLKLQDNIQDIEVYRIPVGKEDWFKKLRIWRQLWKYKSLIGKADVVHCHDVFFWYLPFRFLFPKKPIFTTLHGYEGNSVPSKKAIFMHKLAEKLSWGNICVGDYLKKWYGTKPDYVTYGGVDFTKSQISNLKSQNYNSKLKAVFVGRLEEETGILEYLKAVKILKEKGYELHLEVLGDGSQREIAEKFCNLNTLDVDFKGFVSNISDYLVDADFVFTSRYLGVLEAMAAKRLVFALYNNRIKEDYLKMTPFAKWIIIENSPNGLAHKILYFRKYPDEKEKVIVKGYGWVKTRNWYRVVDMYLSLWHSGLLYL